MSSGERASTSRSSERPKRRKIDKENTYCGLSNNEVRHILNLVGEQDLYRSSDEEPFIDSESEYDPEAESDSEGSLSFLEEELLENCNNEIEDQISNKNLDESNSDHNIHEFGIKWDLNDFIPTVHQFDIQNSGIQNENLINESREVEYFLSLFSEEIANVVVEQTNLFACQNNVNNWKNIDIPELFVFLAITMLMPHVKKSDIKDYWSTDDLISTPSFSKLMPRDRYLQILRYLHFCSNDEVSKSRLYKIEGILNMIKNNFQRQFYPFENLVIDESMVLFKGRLVFKQYIKTKRHRFGIKLYVLCDCETGYVLNYLIYAGKDDQENTNKDIGLGISGAVVVKLLKPFLNKGHSFYSDNFYSSPILSTYLFEHKTNSCGTVRLNRKHMPPLDKKLKIGETDWKSSEHILALKWKDRRDVTMLTTFHENKLITLPKIDRVTKKNKKKPLCVLSYNERMGAIDRSDMMISSVDCTRKTIKWYKKLFFHTLDICMLNAQALYKTQNSSNVLFPKFHMEVVRQLLQRYFVLPCYNFEYVYFLFLDIRHSIPLNQRQIILVRPD